MKRIPKFGSQFGKPKGPRMPAMKVPTPKAPEGLKMAKMKYADGGPTDMGSQNEAMRPSPNPDFQAAMAAERARQAAAMRKDAENIKKSDAAAEARKVREALQESKEIKDRKAFGTAYADASRRNMKKGGSVSSASKRADGCAMKGKTKGKFV